MKIQRCYKEAEFVPRIEKALKVKMPSFICHVVDKAGMDKVMQKAGWNKNAAKGVVGFHHSNKIYVLDDAPWTTLHELIHRTGVNADRINRFLAEGLTELIATRLSKGADEHKATYPQEKRWVKKWLLPRLKMNELQLGQFIIQSKEPHRDLAKLLIEKGVTKKKLADVVDTLRPQVPDHPSFNYDLTLRNTKTPSQKVWLIVGLALVTCMAYNYTRKPVPNL